MRDSLSTPFSPLFTLPNWFAARGLIFFGHLDFARKWREVRARILDEIIGKLSENRDQPPTNAEKKASNRCDKNLSPLSEAFIIDTVTSFIQAYFSHSHHYTEWNSQVNFWYSAYLKSDNSVLQYWYKISKLGMYNSIELYYLIFKFSRWNASKYRVTRRKRSLVSWCNNFAK